MKGSYDDRYDKAIAWSLKMDIVSFTELKQRNKATCQEISNERS